MTSDAPRRDPPTTRLRVAQVLAFVALLAALIGAMGPAERVRTSYSWPPKTLPAEQPQRLWYAPLLLVTHRPEALSVTVPCALPPVLPGAGARATVLATARDPSGADGLALVRAGRLVEVSVGEQILDRIRIPRGGGTDPCEYVLRFEGGRWSLEGGPTGDEVSRGGPVAAMPVVFGFFSNLDLRAGTPPVAEVRSSPHSTRTITRQVVAWTIAALAIGGALLLVALDGRRPGPPAVRRWARAAWAHAHPVDAVVGATLVVWWVLSPAFFDDGWVITRQSVFSTWRGFSAYYNTFAANGPLTYEVDWLQHWLSQSTSAIVYLRLPALACLVVTWLLCRWALTRILASSTGRSEVALWTLGTAFLVGALAWGMTLRTEPVTALLVVAVAACVVRFLERDSATPLAAVALLVPVALTAHPEGSASLAPLLAAAPSLFRWVREHVPVAVTIAAASTAWLAVLLFLGSDLEQRRLDTEVTAKYGLTVAWRYELIRYTSLADFPWGTPLRRAAVVLLVLAVLALLLWGRRRGSTLLDFPATAVAIALVLFVATPSKHPWHFGALLGLGALAIAAETGRFRDEVARPGPSWASPFAILLVASVLVAWTWAPRQQWNALDLRTLDWTPGVEDLLPFATMAALLPLGVLAGAWLLAIVRDQRERLPQVTWRVASWVAPMLAVPLLVFTVAMFVADAVKTDSWTLARQNVATLAGDDGCGLADDLLVAVPAAPQAQRGQRARKLEPVPSWLPNPPVDGVQRFVLGPTKDATTSTPWFDVTGPGGLFLAGSPGNSELRIVSGRRRADGRVRVLDDDPIPEDFVADLGTASLPWRFILPPATAEEANVLRVTLRNAVLPGAAVAVTAPVSYEARSFVPMVKGEDGRALVLPNVLTYFPCLRSPRLGDGVVDVPTHVVTSRDGAWILGPSETSPFLGVLDLYSLQRLPVVSKDFESDELAVLVVDRRIPGAAVAEPVRTTLVS